MAILLHVVSSIEVVSGSASMVQQQVLAIVVVSGSKRYEHTSISYDFIYTNVVIPLTDRGGNSDPFTNEWAIQVMINL